MSEIIDLRMNKTKKSNKSNTKRTTRQRKNKRVYKLGSSWTRSPVRKRDPLKCPDAPRAPRKRKFRPRGIVPRRLFKPVHVTCTGCESRWEVEFETNLYKMALQFGGENGFIVGEESCPKCYAKNAGLEQRIVRVVSLEETYGEYLDNLKIMMDALQAFKSDSTMNQLVQGVDNVIGGFPIISQRVVSRYEKLFK